MFKTIQRRGFSRGGFGQPKVDEHPGRHGAKVRAVDRTPQVAHRRGMCTLPGHSATRRMQDRQRPRFMNRSGEHHLFGDGLGLRPICGQLPCCALMKS